MGALVPQRRWFFKRCANRIAFVILERFLSMRWWLILGLAVFFGANPARCAQLSGDPQAGGASPNQTSVATPQAGTGTSLSLQAKAAFDRGDFTQARDLLLRAVKASPRDASLWFYLGAACSELNDLDQAISAFERAHSLAPRQADTDFNLGLLYWKSGDVGKAKQAYRGGLALNPKEPSALQNYALLLMKTGEYKDAIAPLTKLKNIPSLSLPARVSLIECYIKTEQPGLADREADELLQAGIAGPADQTKLAGIFLENGATQTAVRLLVHSLQLDPDQDRASATLGVIYMRQEKFAESAPLLEAGGATATELGGICNGVRGDAVSLESHAGTSGFFEVRGIEVFRSS